MTLYNGEKSDTTNFTSLEFIKINSCNIQNNQKNALTVLRSNGRVDYHILYVAHGSAVCDYQAHEITVHKGEFVLYPPNVKQRYSFPQGATVITMWIHFTGRAAEEILNELELVGGVYKAPFPDDAEFNFKKLITSHAMTSPKHSIAAKGYLIELLASLSPKGACSPPMLYNDAVSKMLEYINLNWQARISVYKLAKAVGLSPSRAAHLFSETLGESMHHYINRIKLSNAKDLLMNTDMTVSEISAMIGFADPLYFSRAFKSVYGSSPRKIRETAQTG